MMGNKKIIEDGIQKAKDIIDRRILDALIETAFSLEDLRPFNIHWTGNLLDSIGCGVYKNGSLRKFYIPPRMATEPRSGNDEFPPDSRKVEFSESPLWEVPDGVDINKAWWGEDALFNMLKNPPMSIQTLNGWALYYVAAMPYSEIVDSVHNGSVLREEVVPRTFIEHIKVVK